MNYTTFEEAMKQAGLLVEVDAFSVYRAFEQIQDGRHKRGVRYSSALILTLIVLAKLAGMTTLAGIAEWVRLRAAWLNQVLPNPHLRMNLLGHKRSPPVSRQRRRLCSVAA